jgi:putative oxidoreductase
MTDIAARLTPAPAPAPRRRSLMASIMSVILPYALVALALRLLMARVFFLSGQSKIDGMILNFNVKGMEFPVVLPIQIKPSTFQLFETQFANLLADLKIPSSIIAYVFAYAEFLLPICLVLGFLTRFSALVLLIMTVLGAIYIAPADLWSTYVYWAATLLVLLSAGPGAISFDALIGWLYRRDKAAEFH